MLLADHFIEVVRSHPDGERCHRGLSLAAGSGEEIIVGHIADPMPGGQRRLDYRAATLTRICRRTRPVLLPATAGS